MLNRFLFIYTVLFLLLLSSCKKAEVKPKLPQILDASNLYFPPIISDDWESVSPDELDWDTTELKDLYDVLEANNTRAFIILKDGKIVVEQYWGKELLGGAEFNQESNWYWASAGKSLTATLVGLAQQEGLLNIADVTADYLGVGWTSLPEEKEELILIKSQLTMTTGLDYSVPDIDCTLPECLIYGLDPGEQWYYHNAPYTLLEQVLSKAANMEYNDFTSSALADKIGMKGLWIKGAYNNVYYSTARSAARFGLFTLAKGKWGDDMVLKDSVYYQEMINSSQSINPAYGYLWWLNGKDNFRLPGSTISFNGSLAPHAPADLFAAMGKNGQYIDVVPSENLVVIRMGEAPDNALVPIAFHDEIWEYLTKILQ